MKICISTVYYASNSGAFLQAYALKTVLENMGHEVFHLKYMTLKEKKRLALDYDNISKLKYLLKHFGFSYGTFRVYKKAAKCFNVISQNEAAKCDCMIVGSDELWNVTNENIMRYLEKITYNNDNTFAYAIGCGDATYDDLIKYPRITNNIKRIKEIYPRDSFSKMQIERLIGKECKIVCDPTFLLDINQYKKVKYRKLSFDYIMYYGYWSEQETIDILKKYSKQKNLKLCSIGIENHRIETNYQSSPFNFPRYISDSKLMVTSTFHGVIFSMLMNKNFVYIDLGNRKTHMLLKEFNLEDRLLSPKASYEDFLSIAESDINYKPIQEKIKEKRKNGLSVIERILSK